MTVHANLTISKMLITRLSNDQSALCSSDLDRIKKALFHFVKVYFGLIPENIDNEVYVMATNEILNRYPHLTFEGLNLAFSEGEVSKKQGVSLTSGEIVSYIKDFEAKRVVVAEAIKRQNRIQTEIDQKIEQAKEFRLNAEETYKKSLDAGEWLGDMYQADVLAPDYISWVKEIDNDKFKKQAIQEHHDACKAMEESETPFLPVPKVRFFYSQKVIQNAINRRVGTIRE